MLRTSLLVAVVLALGVAFVSAQTKSARGTVVTASDGSVTVKAGDKDMTFAIDSSTKVVARGAGTQTRRAQEAGAAGIKVTDFVKAGQAVMVTYREVGGANQATEIQVITSAGPGGGTTSDLANKIAAGKVKAVQADALVLTSGGKDSTFVIESSTNVVGKGAGTATRAAGGRIPVTSLVSVGDEVSVTYQETAGKLHASEVRMVVKAR